MQECIPFSDLIPGAEVKVTNDNPPLIWAVDLVMAVTGKNRSDAGDDLRDLNPKLFSPEKLRIKSFSGSGNSKVKLVSFQDALELIMVLPGKAAKEIRKKAADILTRYFAGDASLISEIQANAESDAPINQIARDTLGKRGSELADLEQVTRVKRLQLENKNLELSIHKQFMETIQSFYPNNVLDDRMQSMFKDSFINMAFQDQSQKKITNGDEELVSPSLLTVSELADKLGIRFNPGNISKLGRQVSKWYKREYNEKPSQVFKFVNGQKDVPIFAYPERDWTTINTMISDYKS